MKISFSKLADKDLEEIESYIMQDNPKAASKTIKQIFGAIEYLLEFPSMGRIGRISNTRELIISGSPFMAIYQICRQDIFILRILHCVRQWPH